MYVPYNAHEKYKTAHLDNKLLELDNITKDITMYMHVGGCDMLGPDDTSCEEGSEKNFLQMSLGHTHHGPWHVNPPNK